MALIFVQGVYMSAVVLQIHVLPFSCFCIQHRQFISFVSGVVITHCIFVSSFTCYSLCNVEKPCTCVVLSSCTIFGATISNADCGILFSKSCRSRSNATQSSLNLFAFSCIIYCLLMYDS